MLLGVGVESYMLVVGGATIFALLVFQVLEGLRKITFKGPMHIRVHKAVAYALVAVAILHALAALAYLGII